MNIEDYIASGILEDYALGAASDQECREVECMMKIYPEIGEALRVYENDLERFASAYAKKAPADVRGAVMSKLGGVAQESPLSVEKNQTGSNDTGKETRFESRPAEKKSGWGNWVVAAAIIAFIFAAWQYVENQTRAKQIEKLSQEQNTLNDETTKLQNKVAQLSEGLNEVYNPGVKKVMLKSVKKEDNMQIALMWNTKTGRVKLSTDGLPKLPADKQYQLWVLKDGQPSDMGVLPKSETGILVASKETTEGDTFAITVEPLGGKPSPSLDQLVVMGAVS